MLAIVSVPLKKRIIIAGPFFLVLVVWALAVAQAASLTSLSLELSDSEPGATGVQHTFGFTLNGATTTKGIKFEYCTTASGSCSTPTGLSTTVATINTASTTDAYEGWSATTTSNGTVEIWDTTGTTTSPVTVAFDNMTNPTGGVPTTFFVRMTTYDDALLTTIIDGPSAVANAVIPKITVTGVQDAILELTVSAVGSTTLVDDAKNTSAASTASSLPFGNFKPLETTGATSTVVAHTIKVVTNGSTGYNASVDGPDSAALSRVGGGGSIPYVGSDIEWNESSTVGLGVSATGTEAIIADFDTDSDTKLEYFPIAAGLTLATSGAPTAGPTPRSSTVLRWQRPRPRATTAERSTTRYYPTSSRLNSAPACCLACPVVPCPQARGTIGLSVSDWRWIGAAERLRAEHWVGLKVSPRPVRSPRTSQALLRNLVRHGYPVSTTQIPRPCGLLPYLQPAYPPVPHLVYNSARGAHEVLQRTR